MSDNAAKTGDESTQEIDVDSLRESLDARARARAALVDPVDGEALADPADVESINDPDDEPPLVFGVQASVPSDPTPSMLGTLPGHDVAQALRAMMGEVPDETPSYADQLPPSAEITPNLSWSRAPDSVATLLGKTSPDPRSSPSLEDGDTQTRLPDDVTEGLLARSRERQAPSVVHEPADPDDEEDRPRDDEALPAFELEDDEEEGDDPRPTPYGPMTAFARRASALDEPEDAPEDAPPASDAPSVRVTPARSDASPQVRPPPTTRRGDVDESTGVTQALRPTPRGGMRTSETTAVYDGPVPALARRSPSDRWPEAQSSPLDLTTTSTREPVPPLEATATSARATTPDLAEVAEEREASPPSVTILARPSERSSPDPGADAPTQVPHDTAEGYAAATGDELPRFSLASMPELPDDSSPGGATTSPAGWPAASTDSASVRAAFAWASVARDVVGGDVEEPTVAPRARRRSQSDADQPGRAPTGSLVEPPPATELDVSPGPASEPTPERLDQTYESLGSRPSSRRSRPDSRGSRPDARGSRPDSRGGSMDSIDVRISSPDIDTRAFADDAQEERTAIAVRAVRPSTAEEDARDHDEDGDAEEIELEELLPEELVAEPGPVGLPKQTTYRPPVAKVETPAFADNPDAEERELLEERRYGPLIALYRQRLGVTEAPNRQAQLLLKIASVYETGLQDLNEAFTTLVEAFEIAPLNEDVVTAIDRVGKETGRIGELADRVKKKMVPGAPDDKRVAYLGHLVYWYERVLGRGSEVSSFVSDIERHDRVHPVVLKRAAQIAAMNDDTKTQREHLLRALERTVRREEKVALHLALASAYAGTPDALKHYQLALEIDPTSLVALQGIKRLGKEKEQYGQVIWSLERQAEVAPTEAERVDALLELAEIQETKFLKRELAAELLERVLELEPSHPQALKGLERCYHALRDWPKLARTLAARAEHTYDKRSKIELLELAAEVHESKLGDLPGAIEVYKDLLLVEPKHRRALGDLSRLYEKVGDWANVSTYKAQLAELAPTKRASSQELVKLGDFLNAPERDPVAAKIQYERAVVVDPTNAAAWEALQRLAAEDGNIHRVIECLEQRKKHTDVPRQRAIVLVELANVHLDRGDESAARECFEEAIRADSSNETAAIAMLDHYTAEERWAEAAPLCELLVNAAIRDRDADALFIRLRLATRIAAALGDAERSATSAIAALEARPTDPGAQADLIAVCAQSPPAVDRAREHLMRIAESPDGLATDVVVRLAAILRDAGDFDAAAATYERARRLDPEDRELAKELADVYLAQGDFPRACKLKVDLARSAPTAEERFALLVETGEIWARRADELEKAATLFEEARQIKPRDAWLLQTLMSLYGELGDWDTLSLVLEEIVQIHEKPEDKLKTLVAMAEVVRDKLGDRLRAADLYDEALDIDKKRLDLFEELVRTLTEEKNWEKLERSYRRMIARVKDDDAPQLQFALFHQLGLIYRDRLGDASRAYDALDAAARLRPDDADIRRIVVELLVVTDNLDNAVARLREAIDRDPHDPQLYAELYEIFLRQHSFDKAWCVVNVLARLRDPTPEQRRFHEDYAPMPLDQVPGQIVEQAWHSHIFHADLEPALTNLFALMTPAVARLRFGQLRPEQRVGRPFTPTHSRMHDAIRMTFDNAAEILAVTAPELLLGDAKGTSAFSPALAPFGSILVSVPQVEAQSSSLVYLVGKRLAEQRPELAARAFFPSVPDLTSLLGTAVRVSRNEVAKDAAGAALDASFAAILTPQERDGIRSVVLQATADGAPLDVKRWSHLADLSSMRAGLLLCGDVEPARQSIQADTAIASDMPVRDRIGELFKFATSDLYSDLRGAIGVAVQG